MVQANRPPSRQTYRPGAILVMEGERLASPIEVVHGVVESCMGTHVIARHSAGWTLLPSPSTHTSEVTLRAVTIVEVSTGGPSGIAASPVL